MLGQFRSVEIQASLAALPEEQLGGAIRLLFSHPMWDVVENAASLLASIISDKGKAAGAAFG
jgi:hypothetical protein